MKIHLNGVFKKLISPARTVIILFDILVTQLYGLLYMLI